MSTVMTTEPLDLAAIQQRADFAAEFHFERDGYCDSCASPFPCLYAGMGSDLAALQRDWL